MFTNLPPANARACLSVARMSAYRDFFNADSDRECLGAILWHQAVAGAIWPLVSFVEVSLRNRAHQQLSFLFGGSKSRTWYGGQRNDMRLRVRTQQKIDELCTRQDDAGQRAVLSIDDFIAETTFGIWVEVLEQLDHNQRFKFARFVFPAYPPVQNSAAWVAPKNTWQPLINRLARHKSFRDRIAHHSPLWKHSYAPRDGDPYILPTSPGAALQSLRKEMHALKTTLTEMDPGMVDFWDATEHEKLFLSLTTMATLQRYMGVAAPAAAAPEGGVAESDDAGQAGATGVA